MDVMLMYGSSTNAMYVVSNSIHNSKMSRPNVSDYRGNK